MRGTICRTSAPKADTAISNITRGSVARGVLAAWLCVGAARVAGAPVPAAETTPALTSLGRLNALTAEEASRGLPVRLRGTVTYCDRERGLMVVQDGIEAASVRLQPSQEGEEFRPGQSVEVEGATTRNRIRPGIRSRSVRAVGPGEMPEPFSISGEQPFNDRTENRWVKAEGWVPAISVAGNRVSCKLVMRPGRTLDVVVTKGDAEAAKGLPGSYVEITGVFSLRLDAGGQVTGGRVLVNDLGSVRKSRSLPITRLTEAGTRRDKQTQPEPFRVRGTVLNHSLGEFLIVQDNSGTLRIPYRGLNYFNTGSQVEVFAYPLQCRPALVMTNVTVNVVPADSSSEEPAPAIVTPTMRNTNLVTLTQVAQVRKLSPQEASRGYPVAIIGVVTFFDAGAYLHFVQDGTSGIYFDLSRAENTPPLHSGQKLEIQGFSGPGDYAPIVISQAIRVLKESESFPEAENVTFRKLMSGNFDSSWVLLKGVVRNQWLTTNSSTLALFAGDGLIKVVVPGEAPKPMAEHLVDAGVEIRGVCRTIFDDRRRLQGVELVVPGWEQIAVNEMSPADPFKLPVRAVADLFQFHADGGELHRARLMGVVTLRSPDGSVWVQDGSGGIQVQPSLGAGSARVGAMVDVVGFPVVLNKTAMLQEAVVRRIRNSIALEPAELKPDSLLEDTLEASLVRLEAQVVQHFCRESEELLFLQFGQKSVDVVLERKSGSEDLEHFEPGTVVRVTGVYLGHPDSGDGLESFRLMLRSNEDVVVVSRPSWWTVQRTAWVLGAVLAVLLLALGWVGALRREVRQRTKELHEEIEHHKRTEAMLTAEIAERKRMEQEVERSHQELLITSRQAGMAEVATSVLHNVGNVLNSVNVSASVVADKIRQSRISNIARAADMLREHATDLPHFLEQDPKGRQLPQYLGRLAQHLGTEHAAILQELEALRKNVEHIKGIVGMQQSYAKVFGSAEPVNPTELVEDALRLNSGALVRHEVRVVREYQPNLPQVTVDKHKLLQILVNLICNAKKACDESLQPEKRLTVRVANGEGRLKISVIDNGVGISPENLTRIFNHGFTTRKDGHGFGLHSGALAAKEMGGALVAASEGPGQGAAFTVELPVQPTPG
jgi:signal transduction histidine kinase